MKAHIFKQVYGGYREIEVSPEEMFCTLPCEDCSGEGFFWITDEDHQVCVECKGSGSVYVSLV
ncbi:hypothetical protein sp82g_209 [Bacillus phage SP82G]|uniref:Putative heat shock protein n=1 Tax=Bacillus phage vB_BsuM-Goe2 TaxID=1933062 RepID=A0A217EQU2_9CAUD|nr:putative heat shock protein [Bacillus phage vB_BsuM-Goe2]UNY49146.1 hypothetical protein sp82g_209 [Bacillus phage SP82G]